MLLNCEDIARKFVQWCADCDSLRNFCVLYFSEPRAAYFRPAFALKPHHVWNQCATAENRRGKKKELECGPMPNVMVALPNIGGALCSTPQSLAHVHY